MKAKKIWFNLPVKDVSKSRSFYENIGFELNDQYGNSEHSASLLIGEHRIVLMLFDENTFKDFVNSDIADLSKGNEILFNLSAESKDEVDQMVQIVKNAGGKIFAEPKENQGWMYGIGFADPDGHKWNMLYMDMSKAPTEN